MLLVLRGVLCVVWEGFADGLLSQLFLGPMGVLCAVKGGLQGDIICVVQLNYFCLV